MAIPIVVLTYATRSHSYRYNAFPYTAYTAFQAKTPHTLHRIFCRTMSIWAVYGIPYIVCVPGRAPAVSTQEYGTMYGLIYYGTINGRIYGMYK
jgi:hypothetical protein